MNWLWILGSYLRSCFNLLAVMSPNTEGTLYLPDYWFIMEEYKTGWPDGRESERTLCRAFKLCDYTHSELPCVQTTWRLDSSWLLWREGGFIIEAGLIKSLTFSNCFNSSLFSSKIRGGTENSSLLKSHFISMTIDKYSFDSLGNSQGVKKSLSKL